MNHKEGSYQPSHAYDRFLGTFATYCAKNRMKKWRLLSSDKHSVGSQNVKIYNFFGRIDEC